MTCFQLGSTSTSARGRNSPSRATIASKPSRPSVVRPCQPGSPMSEARGTTRTSSPSLTAGAPASSASRAASRRPRRRATLAASGSTGLASSMIASSSAEPAVDGGAVGTELPGDRPRVGGDDVGAHDRVPAREACHVAPAAGRERTGSRPTRRLGGDALDERGGRDQRQVADGGDGQVVIDRGHRDRPRPGRGRERLDAARRAPPRPSAGTIDPRPVDEQVRGRRAHAGRLAAGHRVPAHERQAQVLRRRDDQRPSCSRRP